MRYLTAKEKMELLAASTAENSQNIQESLETGVIIPNEGRIRVKMDIRAYLKQRMEEEGITGYAMANHLGKDRSAFYNFMTGKIPMPLADIEQMLWILDGKITTEEETVQPNILKQ